LHRQQPEKDIQNVDVASLGLISADTHGFDKRFPHRKPVSRISQKCFSYHMDYGMYQTKVSEFF